ncbi:hypothetical protein D3C83_38250 [compost metagenome]
MIVVDDRAALMKKLGRRRLTLHLRQALAGIPEALADLALALESDGQELVYTFDAEGRDIGIELLLHRLTEQGVAIRDLHTSQSSLEEIFVGLLHERKEKVK